MIHILLYFAILKILDYYMLLTLYQFLLKISETLLGLEVLNISHIIALNCFQTNGRQ